MFDYLQILYDFVDMTSQFSLESGVIRRLGDGKFRCINMRTGGNAIVDRLDTPESVCTSSATLLTEGIRRAHSYFKDEHKVEAHTELIKRLIDKGQIRILYSDGTQFCCDLPNSSIFYLSADCKRALLATSLEIFVAALKKADSADIEAKTTLDLLTSYATRSGQIVVNCLHAFTSALNEAELNKLHRWLVEQEVKNGNVQQREERESS